MPAPLQRPAAVARPGEPRSEDFQALGLNGAAAARRPTAAIGAGSNPAPHSIQECPTA